MSGIDGKIDEAGFIRKFAVLFPEFTKETRKKIEFIIDFVNTHDKESSHNYEKMHEKIWAEVNPNDVMSFYYNYRSGTNKENLLNWIKNVPEEVLNMNLPYYMAEGGTINLLAIAKKEGQTKLIEILQAHGAK